jgi:hypothetical protein
MSSDTRSLDSEDMLALVQDSEILDLSDAREDETQSNHSDNLSQRSDDPDYYRGQKMRSNEGSPDFATTPERSQTPTSNDCSTPLIHEGGRLSKLMKNVRPPSKSVRELLGIPDNDNNVVCFDSYGTLELIHFIHCNEDSPNYTKKCRGLIVDSAKKVKIIKNGIETVVDGPRIVCRSFPFTPEISVDSLNEETLRELGEIDLKQISYAYEGSVIRAFNYNNRWMLSTHRKIDSGSSMWSGMDFGTIFKECMGNLFRINDLNKEYCYVFLASHPAVRFACSIDKATLYNIATYDSEGELVNSRCGSVGVSVEYINNIASVPQLVQKIKDINWRIHTGVIINTEKKGLIKVFNKAYEEMKEVRGRVEPNIGIRYLQVANDGRHLSLRSLFKENEKDFDEIDSKLNELVKEIRIIYNKRYVLDEYANTSPICHKLVLALSEHEADYNVDDFGRPMRAREVTDADVRKFLIHMEDHKKEDERAELYYILMNDNSRTTAESYHTLRNNNAATHHAVPSNLLRDHNKDYRTAQGQNSQRNSRPMRPDYFSNYKESKENLARKFQALELNQEPRNANANSVNHRDEGFHPGNNYNGKKHKHQQKKHQQEFEDSSSEIRNDYSKYYAMVGPQTQHWIAVKKHDQDYNSDHATSFSEQRDHATSFSEQREKPRQQNSSGFENKFNNFSRRINNIPFQKARKVSTHHESHKRNNYRDNGQNNGPFNHANVRNNNTYRNQKVIRNKDYETTSKSKPTTSNRAKYQDRYPIIPPNELKMKLRDFISNEIEDLIREEGRRHVSSGFNNPEPVSFTTVESAHGFLSGTHPSTHRINNSESPKQTPLKSKGNGFVTLRKIKSADELMVNTKNHL